MVCRTSPRLTFVFVLSLLSSAVLSSRAGLAFAQKAAAPVQPVAAPTATTTVMPSPTVTTAGPVADETPVAATIAATGTTSPNVSYGVALRLRWVSVPSWMLNLFTKRNVPLSSYATALELMRRKGEFDFIVSVGYQNMSPPDGNWLGRGNNAVTDTDYVQFKGLGFVGIDASFVWHSYLNDWFGLHYGAGLGLGIVTGQMLRTSDGSGCTEGNAGNVAACHPVGITCPNGTCNDNDLAGLNRGGNMSTDSAATPHRFVDPNVPPALPIVNVLVGMDFRLPHVRGWEAKIEGGFYDAFFLGGGVGYTF